MEDHPVHALRKAVKAHADMHEAARDTAKELEAERAAEEAVAAATPPVGPGAAEHPPGGAGA